MLRLRPSRFGWVLLLVLALWAAVAQAQQPRYRYVPLDQVELPPGILLFDTSAIKNSGRVYGTAFGGTPPDFTDFFFKPAVYADGTVSVSSIPQDGFVSAANESGTMGGAVLIDPLNFFFQAALFRGNQVELIPKQPGEITSDVLALNDLGMALVSSFDADFNKTSVLYQNGRTIRLNFGPTVTFPFFLHLNNQGIISGTTFISGAGFRGFRFDTRTGQTTLLDPLATEPDAWALDTNNRGDTLGYSFVGGAIERIGVWDRFGVFRPYFVEGIPEFPTISNNLLFNDHNLIVITAVSRPDSEQGSSYLVPKPGVRLNLADLVDNLPPGRKLCSIQGINNLGNMVGRACVEPFFVAPVLLEHIGLAGATPPRLFPGLESGRQAARAAVAAKLSRHIAPRPQPLKFNGGALPPSSIGDLLMRRR